jgi:hypothetical protein
MLAGAFAMLRLTAVALLTLPPLLGPAAAAGVVRASVVPACTTCTAGDTARVSATAASGDTEGCLCCAACSVGAPALAAAAEAACLDAINTRFAARSLEPSPSARMAAASSGAVGACPFCAVKSSFHFLRNARAESSVKSSIRERARKIGGSRTAKLQVMFMS